MGLALLIVFFFQTAFGQVLINVEPSIAFSLPSPEVEWTESSMLSSTDKLAYVGNRYDSTSQSYDVLITVIDVDVIDLEITYDNSGNDDYATGIIIDDDDIIYVCATSFSNGDSTGEKER